MANSRIRRMDTSDPNTFSQSIAVTLASRERPSYLNAV